MLKTIERERGNENNEKVEWPLVLRGRVGPTWQDMEMAGTRSDIYFSFSLRRETAILGRNSGPERRGLVQMGHLYFHLQRQ